LDSGDHVPEGTVHMVSRVNEEAVPHGYIGLWGTGHRTVGLRVLWLSWCESRAVGNFGGVS
jgi:hypothetical protein